MTCTPHTVFEGGRGWRSNASDVVVAEEDCKAVRESRLAEWGGGLGEMAFLVG